jgi:hypothetical protein
MLNGIPATRFSDTSSSHSMGYKGNSVRLGLRSNDGWLNAYSYPWSETNIGSGSYRLRDSGGVYHLLPIELHDNTANLWGALDGIYYISGFNNAVENTLSIDGHQYVVIQDSFRVGFSDYYAMRLDS